MRTSSKFFVRHVRPPGATINLAELAVLSGQCDSMAGCGKGPITIEYAFWARTRMFMRVHKTMMHPTNHSWILDLAFWMLMVVAVFLQDVTQAKMLK